MKKGPADPPTRLLHHEGETNETGDNNKRVESIKDVLMIKDVKISLQCYRWVFTGGGLCDNLANEKGLLDTPNLTLLLTTAVTCCQPLLDRKVWLAPALDSLSHTCYLVHSAE